MSTFWKITLGSFSLFFLSWFGLYVSKINTFAIQSEDTLPAMFLPVTVINEGTLYADSYYNMIIKKYPHPDDRSFQKGLVPFYFKKVGSHYISAFPLITGLLALPVYFLPIKLGFAPTFELLIYLSHISASSIVAVAGGFFYLLLRRGFKLEKSQAVLLSVVYLFGTVNFAMISQSLWQHGTVQLFLILGLLFMFKSFSTLAMSKKLMHLFFATGFLGVAILARPTAAIVVPFLFLLVIQEYSTTAKKAFAGAFVYFIGFLPALIFFLWYNAKYYVDVANQGYSGQVLTNWLSRFPEGFLGVWFSPSKGILIYSPVILFSFVGLYLAVRRGLWRKNLTYIVFSCIVLMHTLVISKWKHWFGGFSFGYRMSSDVIPFMILLMVPYVTSTLYQKTKKMFMILLTISILVQVFGMIFFDGIWHNAYDRGFKDTSWLWSLRNSEVAFNIRRLLVRFGFLDKACEVCLPGN